MSDIKVSDKLEKFMRDNQLDPFNLYAFAELFMKQQEKIDEMEKTLSGTRNK